MNDQHTTYRIAEDVDAIAHPHAVPGVGYLPILSYLVRGRQPVLIDTGAVATSRGFLEALESLIDPADLAWIVLSHPDTDHSGALPALLGKAPRAKLVLNWVSTGKLTSVMEPPLPRIQWVNAGESLAAGDRVLHLLRPPMYDCPSTVAVFDSKSRALFSSDAFGAFVPEMTETFAGQRSPEAALEGMSFFCRANSPWLADVRPDRYQAALKSFVDLEPSWLLGGHFPAVEAPNVGRIVARAASFPLEGRVPLPGQQALDAALAAMGKAA
ncbi:MAG TPA: MBL fold metallo-hydrolase [Thermoanaerobaculia bacterium]|nr:MBL fold metallo-hydrolase [Thermoanaerobaculia bacterium]HQR66080.1 MBL fold metallo-hydrolase [Thermoanaerobaculia bacterium]